MQWAPCTVRLDEKKSESQSEMSARCSPDGPCSATTGRENTVQKLSGSAGNDHWHTAAGVFMTVGKSDTQLQLAELSPTAMLEVTMQVADQDPGQGHMITT